MFRSRAAPAMKRNRRTVSQAVGCAVTLALALPALAADPPPNFEAVMTGPSWLTPARLDLSGTIDLEGPRYPLDRSRFVNSYWLPSVNGKLSRTGPGDLATYPGRSLQDEIYYEQLSDQAFDQMHRATSRALKDYLLEETGITDLLDGLGRSVENTKLGKASQSTLGIDLGISHLVPEVAFRPKLAAGLMRVSVRLTGSVGFQYRTSLLGDGSRIGARFDPIAGKYTLNYSLDF